MRRHGRRQALILVFLGVLIGVLMSSPPVTAHVGGTVSHLWSAHIKPRTDARYYTKAQANTRFLNNQITWVSNSGVGTEIAGDGAGNDNGTCEANEVCNLNVTCPSGTYILEGSYTGLDTTSTPLAANATSNAWDVAVKNTLGADTYTIAAYCLRA